MTIGQAPEELFGHEVIDSSGKKIGTVDGVWIDDATNKLEFFGVKTGWLAGKTHIIPAENAQIGNHGIQVPYSEDHIKNAPSFSTNSELSPDDESTIYGYYGMQRSTDTSPTGYADGGSGDSEYTDTTSNQYTGAGNQQEINVPVSEEELQVGTRQVEAGRVRVRKVVHTEQQQVPVELRREEIQVERVDGTGTDVPDNAFQEQAVEVPIMREEPVVAKEAHTTGQVRVSKGVETETRPVSGDIRREEVEVDRDGEDFS
ncbi:MAG TPA: PRC and DUF2382 domain-containing protein [Chloroflexota bacterium]